MSLRLLSSRFSASVGVISEGSAANAATPGRVIGPATASAPFASACWYKATTSVASSAQGYTRTGSALASLPAAARKPCFTASAALPNTGDFSGNSNAMCGFAGSAAAGAAASTVVAAGEEAATGLAAASG